MTLVRRDRRNKSLAGLGLGGPGLNLGFESLVGSLGFFNRGSVKMGEFATGVVASLIGKIGSTPCLTLHNAWSATPRVGIAG